MGKTLTCDGCGKAYRMDYDHEGNVWLHAACAPPRAPSWRERFAAWWARRWFAAWMLACALLNLAVAAWFIASGSAVALLSVGGTILAAGFAWTFRDMRAARSKG